MTNQKEMTYKITKTLSGNWATFRLVGDDAYKIDVAATVGEALGGCENMAPCMVMLITPSACYGDRTEVFYYA